MPRKLSAKVTLDELEDEVLFTRAALKADVNAADLLAYTDDWLGLVDAVRGYDREVRSRIADVDAGRAVNNEELDTAYADFGEDLRHDVDSDRESSRWRMFFTMPVSRLIARALSVQVQIGRGWLGLPAGTDPVLEQHRAKLEGSIGKAEQSVIDTRNLKPLRMTVWQRRETLAADLTTRRDQLRDMLAQRARERELSRTWPDVFFRVGETSTKEPEPDEAPEAA